MSDRDHLDALRLEEEADVALVQLVTADGYAPDLTDQELEIIARDLDGQFWAHEGAGFLDGAGAHGGLTFVVGEITPSHRGVWGRFS